MKLYNLLLIVIIIYKTSTPSLLAQQGPTTVPKKVKFADMQLHLTKGAQQRIQKKINNLCHCKKHFQKILERTYLFFPCIEKILSKEQIPLDFKYLAIQESELVSHAMSDTSDAGFWQINSKTAKYLNLNINHHVDERMHIVTSTKAASSFLKGNYKHFNSWLGALLAYNKGIKGASKIFPKKYYGAKVVKIDDKADVYIIHFIAHKLAFEQFAGKKNHHKFQLHEYQKPHGKTLQDVATTLNIEVEAINEYNRWLRLKSQTIPHYTQCSVIVPLLHHQSNKLTHTFMNVTTPKYSSTNYKKYLCKEIKFPIIAPYKFKNKNKPRIIKVNGIKGIIAKKQDTLQKLADIGDILIKNFLNFNEIDISHRIVCGQVYYYEPKNSKGVTHYHVVQKNEKLWDIAQKYGIKLHNLLSNNRMKKVEVIEERRILWLRFIRSKNIPIEYHYY